MWTEGFCPKNTFLILLTKHRAKQIHNAYSSVMFFLICFDQTYHMLKKHELL